MYCSTVEAAGGHRPVQCLTITAVQRECDTQSLSVITAELDPVRAPSLITFFHGHSAGMCLFRWRYSGFSLKQQRILAHVPINTFGIDRRHTIKFCLSAKQRPYPTITIRGQLSDDMMYPEKHIRIISVKTAAAILPVITSSENDVQLLMRHPATTTDDVYSSSPGNKGRALSTFCPSIFDGFFKEFISIVFLPSRRWSSLICFMAAASSEAGTTCSPAATAVRLPSWYCLRQRNNWLPHRVAVQRERLSSPVQGSAEQYRFFLSGTPSAFLRS